jgi:hypothetical protein
LPETTVDEYWSRVIGVYVAVQVGVIHPSMMVTTSKVTPIIRRGEFRFMLVLIPILLKCRRPKNVALFRSA